MAEKGETRRGGWGIGIGVNGRGGGLGLAGGLGWTVCQGAGIAPGAANAERGDYGEVVLRTVIECAGKGAVPQRVCQRSFDFPQVWSSKVPHPLVEYLQQQLLRLWALVGGPFFGLSKSWWSRAARPRGRQRPQAADAHAPSVVGLTTPDFRLSFSRYESPRMLIVVA